MKLLLHSWTHRLSRCLGLIVLGAVLAGCATGPDANPRDPLEPLNRGVSRFNDGLDEALIKPVATAYVEVTPSFVRTGVRNFFANWRDLWSSVNGVLQAKPQLAAENFMRFNVNTFLGLGGLLDIATEAGIPRTPLDFGQTLGRWGVPSGPYVVLPFLGPSTVRDASASFVVDTHGDVIRNLDHVPTRNSAMGVRIIDTRAGFLRAGDLLEEAALDKYSFTRDVYLQRRQDQIDRLRGLDDDWEEVEVEPAPAR